MTSRSRIAVAVLALFLGVGVLALRAQEKLTLTAPVAQTSIADYQVQEIHILRANWIISVVLKSNVSGTISCLWGDKTRGVTPNVGLTCSNGYTNTATAPVGFADVQAMIVALNKANMGTTSLEKRIYNQLVSDGAFVGSVTGSPQ